MVGTVLSMGISAALCSFPLVLLRSKDCSARLLRRDKSANGVEAHGGTSRVFVEGVPVNTYKHAEFILGVLVADASLAKL